MLHCMVISAMLWGTAAPVAAELMYKDEMLGHLVKAVPGLVKSCDPQTGRFGTGIWICRDQEAMYPLAVAYATQGQGNRFYKDRNILDLIMKAGDALIEDADEKGQWVFRKKDGSTWGSIWMPWTYSRWVRSYSLIKNDMPADRREAWRKALELGYTGISRTQLGRVHNIPAHHAMGLYVAGRALERPEWCRQAADFMMKVVGEQAEGGYWSEHEGPVVGYNFVYVDALGTYYALSDDKRVLPALEKAAVFHEHFRYPNGYRVETIDERNPYHEGIDTGNVGFTMSAAGRLYLNEQWRLHGREKLSADLIASLLLYGKEGAMAEKPAAGSGETFVLTEKGQARAATLREGPWFVCLSGYTAPLSDSRWIQDRQNLVSIYHDKVGLILGGGNTKLQPAWSSFAVGDVTLLQHREGDTSPAFLPKGELYHVPSAATVVTGDERGLDLKYGPQACRIRVRPVDDRVLEYSVKVASVGGLPVAAHLTLIPHLGKVLKTDGGEEFIVSEKSIDLSASQVGGAVIHAGYRIEPGPSATLHWPALPHNPYRKDGRATAEEGRIVIRLPFERGEIAHLITLRILE